MEETSAGLAGEVISHLDDTDNVEMHKLFILNKRDIRQKMPDDVMQEASKLEITPDALKGRVDLRKDTIITIDPLTPRILTMPYLCIRKTETLCWACISRM